MQQFPGAGCSSSWGTRRLNTQLSPARLVSPSWAPGGCCSQSSGSDCGECLAEALVLNGRCGKGKVEQRGKVVDVP